MLDVVLELRGRDDVGTDDGPRLLVPLDALLVDDALEDAALDTEELRALLVLMELEDGRDENSGDSWIEEELARELLLLAVVDTDADELIDWAELKRKLRLEELDAGLDRL